MNEHPDTPSDPDAEASDREPTARDSAADSEAGESLVRIEQMGVEFGSQRVLEDLNFDIPRGQTLAIIGESGCGKTVLLKTIIGLVRPTEGRIFFDGKQMTELHEHDLTAQRQRFGFVFQNAALFDSMTVGQNVAFPLRQHSNYSSSRIREIVLERLAQVGLPDTVVSKKPAELSGGMRKRVGLARALAMEPEIILYDEPTTGLDPIMTDVINELIMRTRHHHSVTSVVVTHDMRTARKVADRVIMLYPHSRLRNGESQVLFDGPPSQLERTDDRRVIQFVRGEAGNRLMEMREEGASAAHG